MHTSFSDDLPQTGANLQQLLAASALIVTLERIASSGALSERDEADARILICRACRAFEIPTVAERAESRLQTFGSSCGDLRCAEGYVPERG